MSFSSRPAEMSYDPGAMQTWDRPFRDQQHLDSEYEPADIFVEREQKNVYRGPGVSLERRIVEFADPPRPRRDSSTRRPGRSSGPGNPHRQKMVPAGKGRPRHDSSDTGSESDSDSECSSPRRFRSRKHYSKDLPVVRASPIHAKPSHGHRSMEAPRSSSQRPPQGPPGRPKRNDNESDYHSDDNGGKKAQPKPPPKQILYTGLACIASIAAANNIYQSAKAHYAREKELKAGEITPAEAEKLKIEARKMDLISLGVAAVGAYNVRNGWRRAEGHWKAHKELQAEERR